MTNGTETQGSVMDKVRAALVRALAASLSAPVAQVNSSEVSRRILADVNTAKYIILGCAGLALGLSWVWLCFLRVCAGVMVRPYAQHTQTCRSLRAPPPRSGPRLRS